MSTWTDVCTDSTRRHSCAWNTTGETDALYDLRVVGDRRRRQHAHVDHDRQPPRRQQRADGVAHRPGTPLTGAVTLTATATDAGGIASVAFQRAPAGAARGRTSAPPPAAVHLLVRHDGGRRRQLRPAGRGHDTLPAGPRSWWSPRAWSRTSRRSASTSQDDPGGAIAGRARRRRHDLAHVERADPPASGSPAGRHRDGDPRLGHEQRQQRPDGLPNAAGTTGWRSCAAATDLRLRRNYVSGAVILNGTMVRATATRSPSRSARGSRATVLTAGAATITWRPSASALDATGKAGATTATVTECGTADADF